jgi:HAD superfamily hydrolase (TIGR01509 family)
MPLKGLFFDFDGLILETEIPGFKAWEQIYAEYGESFTHDDWKKAIGTGPSAFDPAPQLSALKGKKLDEEALRRRAFSLSLDILEEQPMEPGVLEFLLAARAKGIRMAVVSSSPGEWVYDHLERLKIRHFFETVCTEDDVKNVKPDPELYQLALQRMDILASEAAVFEDSPNGLSAARLAGIRCFAIPNEITRTMDISHAEKIYDSFHDIVLEELIEQYNQMP